MKDGEQGSARPRSNPELKRRPWVVSDTVGQVMCVKRADYTTDSCKSANTHLLNGQAGNYFPFP
jgi:hypothetical protein